MTTDHVHSRLPGTSLFLTSTDSTPFPDTYFPVFPPFNRLFALLPATFSSLSPCLPSILSFRNYRIQRNLPEKRSLEGKEGKLGGFGGFFVKNGWILEEFWECFWYFSIQISLFPIHFPIKLPEILHFLHLSYLIIYKKLKSAGKTGLKVG